MIPLFAVPHKYFEEGINPVSIFFQLLVVYSSFFDRSSCHPEEILDGIPYGKGQAVCKGRIINIKKTLLSSAVCKHRDACLTAHKTRRIKGSIAAAGYVYCTVGVFIDHVPELTPYFVNMKKAGIQKQDFNMLFSMIKVFPQLFLFFLIFRDFIRTEIDDSLREKSIRCEIFYFF